MSSANGFAEVQDLPYQLNEFCIFMFEERLFFQALTLLSNALSSPPPGLQRPGHEMVLVPHPDILSLIGTLVVHPSVTIRASTAEKAASANLALSYLRHVFKVAGSVNARMSSAMLFTSRSRRLFNQQSNDELQPTDRINIKEFRTGSLWKSADDFWHVVGWSFNCSVHQLRRWSRWQLWLDFMLDILESDFKERFCQQDQTAIPHQKHDFRGQDSLVIRYLSGPGSSIRRARRIMRAIFAKGDSASTQEFKEVFRNETEERKQQQELRPGSKKINIDLGEYGDYFDDGDDYEKHENDTPPSVDTSEKRSRGGAGKAHALPLFSSHLNSSFDSTANDEEPVIERLARVDLRVRLLVLLSQVAIHFPDLFVSYQEYCEVVTEAVRSLPVQAFTATISGSQWKSALKQQADLVHSLLNSFISGRDVQLRGNPDSESLRKIYLQRPAVTGSDVDNLKISLLLEVMIWLLKNQSADFGDTVAMQEALELGIEARSKRFTHRLSNRTKQSEDGTDHRVEESLNLSGQRLRLLVRT